MSSFWPTQMDSIDWFREHCPNLNEALLGRLVYGFPCATEGHGHRTWAEATECSKKVISKLLEEEEALWDKYIESLTCGQQTGKGRHLASLESAEPGVTSQDSNSEKL